MKILIVDDSVLFQNALMAILNQFGYTDIVSVPSAQKALEFLKPKGSAGHGSLVDIILMDLMMPEMSGIEAVRTIKAADNLKDIPIIIVSAQDEEQKIEVAFEAGAIDFIGKPIKKLELKARLRSVMKLKEEMDQRKTNEIKLAMLNRSLAEANQKLQQLSMTDGLTGIYNRRFFDETVRKEWQRAIRNRYPISLIMSDIDFFKAYNDYYGHIEGDSCLKQVTAAMQMALKRPGDILARYGGEEFVALLPATDVRGAKQIASAFQKYIREVNIKHDASLIAERVTISMGIACVKPNKTLSILEWIRTADKCLYKAKHQGRNQIVARMMTA